MPTGIVKKVKTEPTYQTGKVTEDSTSNKYKYYQDLSKYPAVSVGDHVSYNFIEFETDSVDALLGEKVAVDLEDDPITTKN